MRDARALRTLPFADIAVLALCYAAADKDGRGHFPSLLITPRGLTKVSVHAALTRLVEAGHIAIVRTYTYERTRKTPELDWMLVDSDKPAEQ